MLKIRLPSPISLFIYAALSLSCLLIVLAGFSTVRATLVTVKNLPLDQSAVTPQEQTLNKVLTILGEAGFNN